MKQTDRQIEGKTIKVNYIYRLSETSRYIRTVGEKMKRQLPKLKVAGSNPVSRSNNNEGSAGQGCPLFCLAENRVAMPRDLVITP